MTPTDRLDSIDARLERLVLVSEQQAASIERIAEASEAQRQSIQTMVGAVSELAWSHTQLSQTSSQLVALAERSAQEGSANLAQSNQMAMRDVENLLHELIEELRLGRGGQP